MTIQSSITFSPRIKVVIEFKDKTICQMMPARSPGVMVAATAEADGEAGLVPKPLAGDEDRYLAGDGQFKNPAETVSGPNFLMTYRSAKL